MEPDLRDLLAAWLGESLPPPRSDELLARVRRDEAFRRAFVAEVRMLGKLKAVQSAESRWLRLEDELGWSAAESSAGESLEDRVVRQLPDPPRRRPSRRRTWGIAAAAVLLMAGLVASFWPSGPHPGPAPIAAGRPYPRVDSLTGLAMVLRLDGVRWEPTGDPQPSEGDVLAAGRLRFRSGRATLSMLTGVVLVLEGPADVELVSSNEVLCHRGRLRARAPAGAEGFLVSGPRIAVIDLGTEFGLNVGADGIWRGRVFEGVVEAALLSAAGTPLRSYYLDASRADATRAFEIDPRTGRIDAVAASDDFIAPSDLVAPPWSWTRTIPPQSSGRGPGATGGSIPWPTARRRTRSPGVPRCA